MTIQLEPIVELIGQGNYDKAVQSVRSAKADTRQAGDSLLWTKFLMLEAVAFYEKGQFQKAYQTVLNLFDPLLYYAPVWLEPYVVDILMLGKDMDRALRYFERHLAHNAPSAEILFLQARILFKNKDYKQARDALTDALTLAPDRADLNLLMAECLRGCGQYGRAMRAAELAWEQGAIFAVTQMIRLAFVRKGTCNACEGRALCCQSPRLVDGNFNIVRSQWQFDSLLFLEPRLKVWRHVSSNDDGDWLFKCSLLSPQGACTRYRERPHVCRNLPEDPISARRYPPCAYRFEIFKKAPKFRLPGAFEAVCRALADNGCLEELAKLKAHNQ